MSLHSSLFTIPNFITAKTANGLRRLMLRKNAEHGVQFVWHSILFVEGKWYAWFYAPASEGFKDGNESI